MKKTTLILGSAAAMLFAACSSADAPQAPAQATTTVDFSISVPSSIQSRAISDGTTVEELYYAIFDSDGTWIEDVRIDAFAGSALKQTVSIQLVNGKSYQIAFWAQAPGAPYTFKEGTVTVSYASANANDENRDAFYGLSDKFTVTPDLDPDDVVLKRPFAQVNVGVGDYNEAKSQNVGIKNAGMTFTASAYTKLNLLTGVASSPVAVTFAKKGLANSVDANGYAVADSKELVLKDGSKYHWMTMNYLLVNADKETIGTASFTNDGTEPQMDFYQVPVQRNYRTNIVGNLLTTTSDWNVIIEPGYVDDINHDPNTPPAP